MVEILTGALSFNSLETDRHWPPGRGSISHRVVSKPVAAPLAGLVRDLSGPGRLVKAGGSDFDFSNDGVIVVGDYGFDVGRGHDWLRIERPISCTGREKWGTLIVGSPSALCVAGYF